MQPRSNVSCRPPQARTGRDESPVRIGSRFLRRVAFTGSRRVVHGSFVFALASASVGCSREADAQPSPAPSEPEAAAPAAASTPVKGLQGYDPARSLAPMIDAVRPAVVSIRVHGKPTAGRPIFGVPGPSTLGGGSGFVLEARGIVVTNHHVVDGAERLEVRLADGRTFDAELLGSDAATDLAVLELQGAHDLPVATLGSSESLRVGDWVVAIGSPMGLEHSASVGILSGRGRGNLGLYHDSYIDFLQTDADIAPGSSGGPLFDLEGRVIGITTAVGANAGPGFAIPIEQARKLIPELRDRGEVIRGWLGAGNDPEREGDGLGAAIGAVYPGTPAAEAGLQPGDRVVTIDGTEVPSFEVLRSKVADLPPGHTAMLGVKRGDQTLALPVVLAERPDADALASLGGGFGWPSVTPTWPEPPRAPVPAPEDAGARLGASARPHAEGLEVLAIEPGSLAEDLALAPGDVLTEVNGQRVKDPADVRTALARGRDRVEVSFRRGGVTHRVTFDRR